MSSISSITHHLTFWEKFLLLDLIFWDRLTNHKTMKICLSLGLSTKMQPPTLGFIGVMRIWTEELKHGEKHFALWAILPSSSMIDLKKPPIVPINDVQYGIISWLYIINLEAGSIRKRNMNRKETTRYKSFHFLLWSIFFIRTSLLHLLMVPFFLKCPHYGKL